MLLVYRLLFHVLSCRSLLIEDVKVLAVDTETKIRKQHYILLYNLSPLSLQAAINGVIPQENGILQR